MPKLQLSKQYKGKHCLILVCQFSFQCANPFLYRIAVNKALYSFGGYMSDVVAAVDQV